jgi:hypothetical protein
MMDLSVNDQLQWLAIFVLLYLVGHFASKGRD